MENELSPVVDTLPGLVWTALPDGNVDFVNRYWCEYTGLGVDEAYGPGWQTAIHPEDLPELLERWRSILASGEPGRMEAAPAALRWRVSLVCLPYSSAGRRIRTDRQMVRNQHRY